MSRFSGLCSSSVTAALASIAALKKYKLSLSDYLKRTAYDKHCQRRIYKKSNPAKKKNKQKQNVKTIKYKADTTRKTF